jgi:hypothetical protein
MGWRFPGAGPLAPPYVTRAGNTTIVAPAQ